jgi:predicted nuclease of restriction endonuclease-like (RecB) superfamily
MVTQCSAGSDRDGSSRAPGPRPDELRAALPESDSELVRDAIKDPYNFEFLGLARKAKERDLEQALLNDVQSFLMEMGRGFALVGRQFPLRVTDEETGDDHEFFIDLLFYNYLLRRFVVIDLKVEDFKPELTGKMLDPDTTARDGACAPGAT